MNYQPNPTEAHVTADQFATSDPLAGSGVLATGPVHANLTAAELVTHALRRGEGRLSAEGALIVKTGVHTGRSVQDKFSVDDPSITDDVWWRPGNRKLDPAHFQVLKGRVQAYLQGRELFTQDLYAGADPQYRVRVRLVSSEAWQTLFARNMFIRPKPEELASFEPDYVILHAPQFQADPAIDGVRSGTHELVRPGGFTLFCSRAAWRSAAAEAAAKAGVRIDVVVIGARAEYRDVEGSWARLRQVDAMGAVLVRPDAHVAWRSRDMPVRPAAALAQALRCILHT